MVKQITKYQNEKILYAEQLNQDNNSQSTDALLGFFESSGLPKPEFNIGDLTAIVNGALVGDLLAREGKRIKVYNAASALIVDLLWEDLITNLQQATESNLGVAKIITQVLFNAGINDTDIVTTKKLRDSNLQIPVLIGEVIASNQATVDFVTGIDNTYKKYVIEIINMHSVNDSVRLGARYSQNAGGVWLSANYQFAQNGYNSNGASSPSYGNAQDRIYLTDDTAGQKIGNAAGESYSADLTLYSPSTTGNYKKLNGQFSYQQDAGSYFMQLNGGGDYQGNANAVNGLRFLLDSGDIASGIFRLYGIK